ncbi:hypothetical protein SK128_011633, partial [Halocaridina rubra]
GQEFPLRTPLLVVKVNYIGRRERILYPPAKSQDTQGGSVETTPTRILSVGKAIYTAS